MKTVEQVVARLPGGKNIEYTYCYEEDENKNEVFRNQFVDFMESKYPQYQVVWLNDSRFTIFRK